MNHRTRDDLDPQTRQALVALTTPEPPLGEPQLRLFPSVIGTASSRLTDEVIARERDFVANEPHGHPQRNGWVLADPPPPSDQVLDFVTRNLGDLAVELRLGFDADMDWRPQLELSDVVVTAHRDGDFLGPHHDDGWPGLRNGRLLSFVYWFQREPRPFGGGNLTLSGWARTDDALRPTGPRVDLEPANDTLVVFPSCTRHEAHAVQCSPDDFGRARFALVGFIRRVGR